ncbi:MAG: hypothetical protein COB12_03530 [Flavobacterium sp.]|nr:MAG: hypothetical protein COB12_03530 [Flavobacterium sp.]
MSDENKNNLENEVKDSANEFKEGWNQATAGGENKKLIAGLLGILIGGLGIHKFILGYTKEGIIQIVITFITCGVGSLVGLIEGIIYLTKSDEEFYNTYQVGKRPWF